jgi:hypothetical protein
MTASPPPPPPPPQPGPAPRRCFQELVSDAIIAGDLTAFKKCAVGRYDIDRRILEFRDLPYKRKYNPDDRYVPLRGPTITMLAILCEQDEILEYVLENKSPDLSVRVEGYTALHLAAMVKDHRPLKLLLRYQWVQENINLPMELPGVPSQQGDETTALHIAVTNHRLTNVLLLLSELPPYKRMPPPKGPAPPGSAPPESPAVETGPSIYQPANVDQRSSIGSTPLYIATFLRDPKIVRVLLAAGADQSIQTAKKKPENNDQPDTPLALATRLKADVEKTAAARERAGVRPRDHGRKRAVDPIFEVYNLLTTPPEDDLEKLKHEFAPELIEAVKGPGEGGEEEEEEAAEEPVPKEKKGKAKKAASASAKKIDEFFELLKNLTRRVEQLERGSGPGVLRPGVRTSEAEIVICTGCGTAPAKACDTCRRTFCDTCVQKVDKHTGCV